VTTARLPASGRPTAPPVRQKPTPAERPPQPGPDRTPNDEPAVGAVAQSTGRDRPWNRPPATTPRPPFPVCRAHRPARAALTHRTALCLPPPAARPTQTRSPRSAPQGEEPLLPPVGHSPAAGKRPQTRAADHRWRGSDGSTTTGAEPRSDARDGHRRGLIDCHRRPEALAARRRGARRDPQAPRACRPPARRTRHARAARSRPAAEAAAVNALGRRLARRRPRLTAGPTERPTSCSQRPPPRRAPPRSWNPPGDASSDRQPEHGPSASAEPYHPARPCLPNLPHRPASPPLPHSNRRPLPTPGLPPGSPRPSLPRPLPG
jgi:hypothetical protein